jgi:hypothetical protein
MNLGVLRMRGPVIVAIVLAVAWYIDQSMYGGQYLAAISQMLANIAHHSR